MRLIYTGETIDQAGVVPLPEGWPAADHDEPDRAIAAAKLTSGVYREPESTTRAKGANHG